MDRHQPHNVRSHSDSVLLISLWLLMTCQTREELHNRDLKGRIEQKQTNKKSKARSFPRL